MVEIKRVVRYRGCPFTTHLQYSFEERRRNDLDKCRYRMVIEYDFLYLIHVAV